MCACRHSRTRRLEKARHRPLINREANSDRHNRSAGWQLLQRGVHE